MVRHTGTTPDTRRIRRLKTPLVLVVKASQDGVPLCLKLRGVWQDVTLLRRPWRIDQQWWRAEPVRRDYFRVAPEDGPPLTLYHDALSGEWYRQEYG